MGTWRILYLGVRVWLKFAQGEDEGWIQASDFDFMRLVPTDCATRKD